VAKQNTHSNKCILDEDVDLILFLNMGIFRFSMKIALIFNS